MLSTLIAAALLSTGDARAFFPDDISLSSMASFNENPVDAEDVNLAYREIVREMGAAAANKPGAPVETLGINGFGVGLDSSISFVSADIDGTDPSSWQRAHEDNDPSGIMWIPRIVVQKGLPISLEVGGSVGYVGFSRQTLLSGWGRWGLLEGYRKAPDINIQAGYSGLVGNEELELGVMDFSFNIGYSLPFGTIAGINETKFSPYGGIGRLYIHAAPRMSEEDQEDLGVAPISGFKDADSYDEEFRPLQVHGGFQITKGAFQFHSAMAYSIGTLSSVNLGLGFVY